MNILLTNDDGIHAAGLWALYAELSANHDVSVVAPDRERSAVSHSITLHEPLRLKKIKVNGGYGGHGGHAVNGTPADCVKLGILEILDKKPDIVISGINCGANVGVNINYSGTVAAAREASLFGCQSVAVSIMGTEEKHYETAASFIRSVIGKIFENGLPFGTMLNVNVPDLPESEIAGVRTGRQSIRPLSEYVEKRTDPRNRVYFWQGADMQSFDPDSDVDGAALYRNCISITPLKCDMTDYESMRTVENWGLEFSRGKGPMS